MNWYKNLRLRTKLILGFIATALLTVLVGWQGMAAAKTMSRGSDAMYYDGVKGIRVTGKITQDFGNMRQRLRDLMILTSPEAQKRNKQQYDDNRAAVHRHYVELFEITKNDPDLTHLVSKTSSTLKEWLEIVDQAVELAVEGKIQEAVQRMSVTAVPINTRFLGELEELSAAMDRAAANIDESNRSIKRMLDLRVMTITLAVFIASVLLGITISNMVAGTLDRLSVIVQKVATGDLTAHFVAESKDELGIMAIRLEKMVEQIWDFTNNVSHGVSSVAVYAAELSNAAEEMSSKTEQISHSADIHINSSKRLATSMAELSASIGEVSGGAQETLSQLKSATETIQDKCTSEADKGALGDIKQATGRLARAIDVIHEISRQANLLSNNVAIEAEKIDERGKGFAVAAEEVRRLAKRSATSAKEIAQRNLEARTSVERTGEMVAITMELLRDLRVDIGLAAVKVASEQEQIEDPGQKSTSGKSANALAAYEMSSATNSVAHTAKELTALASELQEQIRHFKLTNKI